MKFVLFVKVLEVRNENLKSQRNRAEQFASGGVTTSLPVSVRTGYHTGTHDVTTFLYDKEIQSAELLQDL